MIKIWRSETGKAMLGVLIIFAAVGAIFFFSSFATNKVVGSNGGMHNVGLRLYYDSSTGQFRPIGAGWPADVNFADANLIVLGIIVSGDITANNLEVNDIDANAITATTVTATGLISAGSGTATDMLAPLNITGDTASIEDRHEGIWIRGKTGAYIVQINVRGPRLEIGGGASLDTTPAMSINYLTGHVGIGTTTPDYILDIDAGEIGGNNYDGLRIVDTGWQATSHPMLEFYNSNALFNGSLARIYGEIGDAGTNSKLYFAVADSSKNLQDRMVIETDGDISMAHSLGVGGDLLVTTADANVSVDEIYINEIHNPDDPNLYWLWVPASSGSGSGGWRFTREKSGVDPVLFNIYEMTVDQPANPFREFQQVHFNAHSGEFLFVIEGNAAFPTNYPHFFIVDANKNQVGIDMWPEDIRSAFDVNDGDIVAANVFVDTNVASWDEPDKSIDFSTTDRIRILSGGKRLTTYITGQAGKTDWSIRNNPDADELINWWVYAGGQQMLKVTADINTFDIGDGTNFTRFTGPGDLFFAGTAGLIYGHMDIPAAAVVTVDTSATGNPVEVKDDGTASANDGWTSSYQNGVTFAVSNLHYQTVTFAGTYEVIWDMSPATAAGAGTLIHGGITIDSTTFQRDNGEGHAHVFNANDNIQINGIGTIDCPNGNEEISLWITNDQNQKTIIEHGNMRIQLIGGT